MPGEASETRIQELELVVERDPSTALYLPLAERLRDMGRVEDAIRLCEARKTRPGRGVGDAIVLGRCYLADGRLAEARAEFETALRLDRENVIALKALAGILAHEGRHSRAVELYRAVCRVDPGDLESQTALHQITSGEFAEVSPADVVVGQGDLGWHPVRLPREEDHLADLAMGLRMIDTFETPPPVVERRQERGFREFSLDDLDRKKPAAEPSAPAASSAAAAPPASPAPPGAPAGAPAPAGPSAHPGPAVFPPASAAPAPAPTRAVPAQLAAPRAPAPPDPERFERYERYEIPTPVTPAEERQEALGAPIYATPARPAPILEPEAEPRAEPEPKAEPEPVGARLMPQDAGPGEPGAPAAPPVSEQATPVSAQTSPVSGQATPTSEKGKRDEVTYKPGVSGNRSAFQDWLRRLGGGS